MDLRNTPCPLALHPHRVLASIAATCFGLIAFGVVLQAGAGIEPCPLCIFQRYAFLVTGLLASAGALHRGPYWVSRAWAGLVTLAALIGAGIAGRQTWLQHNPPEFPECGGDLAFMLDSVPLAQVLPMVFRGSGDCSKVDWTLLGFSIAEWALACFVAIALCALAVTADRYASKAR